MAPDVSWSKLLNESTLSERKASEESTPKGMGRLVFSEAGRKTPMRCLEFILTGVTKLYCGGGGCYDGSLMMVRTKMVVVGAVSRLQCCF